MSAIRRSVGYAGALEERLIALRVAKELSVVKGEKSYKFFIIRAFKSNEEKNVIFDFKLYFS